MSRAWQCYVHEEEAEKQRRTGGENGTGGEEVETDKRESGDARTSSVAGLPCVCVCECVPLCKIAAWTREKGGGGGERTRGEKGREGGNAQKQCGLRPPA